MLKKLEKQIVLVRDKLITSQEKFNNDRAIVESLSNKLASALANNLVEPNRKIKIEIEEISKRIEELKNEIELAPKVIEALENKLALLEEKKKNLVLEEKIAKQKLTGGELVAVSKKFINSLKEAKVLNTKLRSLWNLWNLQKAETKYNKLPDKASMFSYDMLNYLGILVSEYEGKEIRKREYFSRIRL